MAESQSTESLPYVRRERDERGVVRLTLSRPQSFNALSEGMLAALQGELDTVAGEDGARVVVIAAEGKAFCAGHDLKELTARRDDPDGGRAFYAQTMTQCAALMQSIVACEKPVIAVTPSCA